MKERKAVTQKMRERYRQARKKQKGQLLDELVALTGCQRGQYQDLNPTELKRNIVRLQTRFP